MEYQKAPYWVNYFLMSFFVISISLYQISNTLLYQILCYADDNKPFAMVSSELDVINEIKEVLGSLTLWFPNNCMKVNPDKFHLLLSDKKIHQVVTFNDKLSSTCNKKLLG